MMLPALLLAGCAFSGPPAFEGERDWVLSAEAARAAYARGAQFIDVRSAEAYEAGHISGSVHVSWLDFSDGDPDYERGRLIADDARLGRALSRLGISKDRAVVVIGDPVLGWGEDGRILWMLRTLGHPSVALVDGGFDALAFAGVPIDTDPVTPEPSTFEVDRTNRWTIERDEVRAIVELSDGSTSLVDTREPREFEGQTPYGEVRGGHVPGAVNVHYRRLLTPSGHLRSRQSILDELAKVGVTPDRPVVAYCTGGVRSGWFVAVLWDLGFVDVRNYAGSMWEWAAAPESEYPLGP
jgi:thiosulfate/3-mercaptopyruvate sulfurtransferase